MNISRLKWLVLSSTVCLVWASYSFAELYKWVDANGVAHFSDQPHKEDPNDIPVEIRPSISSKPTVKKIPKSNTPPALSASNPYRADAPAGKTSPPDYGAAEVALFVTQSCRYCNMARDYLNAKGIPFTEYDVQKDKTALQRKRRLDPRRGVPLAVINGQTVLGFSPAAYEAALATNPR